MARAQTYTRATPGSPHGIMDATTLYNAAGGLLKSLYADLGGVDSLSDLEKDLCQRYAEATLLARGAWPAACMGDRTAQQAWRDAARLSAELARILGLKRRARDVSKPTAHDPWTWARELAAAPGRCGAPSHGPACDGGSPTCAPPDRDPERPGQDEPLDGDAPLLAEPSVLPPATEMPTVAGQPAQVACRLTNSAAPSAVGTSATPPVIVGGGPGASANLPDSANSDQLHDVGTSQEAPTNATAACPVCDAILTPAGEGLPPLVCEECGWPHGD